MASKFTKPLTCNLPVGELVPIPTFWLVSIVTAVVVPLLCKANAPLLATPDEFSVICAMIFLYGVPLETMLVAEVMTPVESIDAIVVAPYLNNNLVPLCTIEKFAVTKEPAEPVVS